MPGRFVAGSENRHGERRGAPRLSRLHRSRLTAGGQTFRVVVTDISQLGAFLRTPPGIYLPTGLPVTLQLGRDEPRPAIVVRSVVTPGREGRLTGIGVRFGTEARRWTGAVVRATAGQMQSASTGAKIAHEAATEVERRSRRRRAIGIDVDWRREGELPEPGRVVNVCEHGLYIQSRTLPGRHQTVTLILPVGDDIEAVVRLTGIVRRQEPGDGFALRLTRVEDLGRTGAWRLWLRRLDNRHPTPRRRGYHYGIARRG